MSAKPKPISGLARRLIQDGLIELEAAEKYSLEAAKARRPLVSYLVKENIVAGGVDNPAMKALIKNIANEVSGGNSFAAAVSAQPKEYFDELFCNLIAAGSNRAHSKPCWIASQPIKKSLKR